jgi:hypothetical protein
MSGARFPPETLARGWASAGHAARLLRASLHRQLTLSVLLGLVLGSALFLAGLGPEVRPSLRSYVRSHALCALRHRPAACQETKRLRRHVFGERDLRFLAQQWGLRVAVLTGFLFVGVVAGTMVYGRTTLKERRLRGGGIVHPSRSRTQRLARVRVSRLGVLSFLLGVTLACVGLGAPARASLWGYGLATLTRWFPVLDGLRSPAWGPGLGWYPPWGFVTHADAQARHLLHLGGMQGFWLRGLGLLGSAAFGAWVLGRLRRGSESVDPNPLTLAGVPFELGRERYHTLIMGSTGSGKSTAIKDLLRQLRAHGQRAIVYDISGEYLSAFYRPGIDRILNPGDPRSERWSLWAEVHGPEDYTSLAQSLFPAVGREPFWATASAVLFASTAEALSAEGTRENSALYQTLTHSALDDLHTLLANTPAARLLDPKAGAMPSNLIATVTSQVAAWAHLPDPPNGQPGFSIRRFLEAEAGDGWLFLPLLESQRSEFRPLVSLWCDIAALGLLSRPPDVGPKPPKTWCVLDEVASLQQLPALPALLERGRKHGAAVVLGLQGMPQLRDIYGRDLAAHLAAQPQTWLVLRTVEPETAQWLEQALGEVEVESQDASLSVGRDGDRDSLSFHTHRQRKARVLATEIMSLPDRTGLLRRPGEADLHRVYLPLPEGVE